MNYENTAETQKEKPKNAKNNRGRFVFVFGKIKTKLHILMPC